MIINVLLGFGALLSLNENIEALWLNAIGVICFVTLLALNPQTTQDTK